MKKLIIILTFLISSILSYSQGVKISAMPQWTSSLDSVWFPIINFSDPTWVNYRAQGWQIGKERIDSIINNWPVASGFMRFGYPAEDVLAAENRDFDQSGNQLIIHGGLFQHYIGDVTEATAFSTIYHDAGTVDIKAGNGSSTDDWEIIGQRGLAGGGRVDLRGTSTAGSAAIQIGNNVGWSGAVAITVPTGNLRFIDIIDSVQSYVLYTNPSNWKVTYHAAPTGGGGIQSMDAANGLSMRNDSTTILGGTADQNTTNTWGAFTWTHTFNTLVGSGITISTNSTTASNQKLIDLSLSGANASSGISTYGLYSSNTHTGTSSVNYGVYGIASGGATNWGVYGDAGSDGVGVRGNNSSSGTAVQGQSSTGTGVIGISSAAGFGGSFQSATAAGIAATVTASTATNTPVSVAQFAARANGTPTNGYGGYLSLQAETNGSSSGTEAARLQFVWTDITNASRTSDIELYNYDNGTGAIKATLKATGNFILNTTAKGYGLKSPDGTIWYITVNNSGVLSTSTTAP